MVLVPAPGTDEIEITETIFETEKSTYEIEVVNKLTAYDTLCETVRANSIALINGMALMNAKKQEKIDEIQLRHIEKVFDREIKIKTEYEKQFESKLEVWKADKENLS